jgi:ABC-2 type transport system permease protein
VNGIRLLSLVRKEFIQILRDPRTLGITFIMPLVQLFLLGFAATNDVRNVPLVVIDRDHSAASRQLLDTYRAADYFHVDYDVATEAELRHLIDDGQATAGLIIPPGYSEQLVNGNGASVSFIIDGSDPAIAGTALSAAQLIGQSKSTALVVERAAARGQAGVTKAPLEVRTQVWYNPDLISAYYMIPGLIGTILLFLTTNLTASAIVREREQGTIEQLIVTPLRPIELMVGKLAPFVMIAMIDMVEILLVGTVVFKVPINGSLTLLLGCSALFLATTLSQGLLISTMAKTQREAQLSSMFFTLPAIFLSGFFFPVAAMPPILQLASYLIPLRYFLVIARAIVLKGVSLDSILPQVEALVVFAVVFTTVAALRFHKTLD